MSDYFGSFYTDLLTEDIERQSEWEAPFGFLMGGIAVPDRVQLATQYTTAADLLIAAIDRKDVADYDVAYPVMFFYRQAVELLFKNILGPSKIHDLQVLSNRLDEHARTTFGNPIHPWITAIIHDLAMFDDGSMTYRYFDTSDPSYTNAKVVGDHPLKPAECHVNLYKLKEQMRALTDVLIRYADLPQPLVARFDRS